jgi:hypothetical protein
VLANIGSDDGVAVGQAMQCFNDKLRLDDVAALFVLEAVRC